MKNYPINLFFSIEFGLSIEANMKLNPTLAPEYEGAALAAFLEQWGFGFCSYFLDNYFAFHVMIFTEIWALGCFLFWGFVLWIVLRRRLSPTKGDLGIIRFGFVPLWLLLTSLSILTWKIQGLV